VAHVFEFDESYFKKNGNNSQSLAKFTWGGMGSKIRTSFLLILLFFANKHKVSEDEDAHRDRLLAFLPRHVNKALSVENALTSFIEQALLLWQTFDVGFDKSNLGAGLKSALENSSGLTQRSQLLSKLLESQKIGMCVTNSSGHLVHQGGQRNYLLSRQGQEVFKAKLGASRSLNVLEQVGGF
jgi:hypothetical protein